MAAIDHTVIIFKNGKWVEDVDYDSLPFEFGRDGDIHSVNYRRTRSDETLGQCITWDTDNLAIPIRDDIEWYKEEYDALYERAGIRKIYPTFRWTLWSIINRMKWLLRRMERVGYRVEVGKWFNDNAVVFIYHEPMKRTYISFYRDKRSNDTYIVLGGYGHHENVYTHFMHRGYGIEFERKMAQEAFSWCCTDVLEKVTEYICKDILAAESWLRTLQWAFRDRYVGEEPDESLWRESDKKPGQVPDKEGKDAG